MKSCATSMIILWLFHWFMYVVYMCFIVKSLDETQPCGVCFFSSIHRLIMAYQFPFLDCHQPSIPSIPCHIAMAHSRLDGFIIFVRLFLGEIWLDMGIAPESKGRSLVDHACLICSCCIKFYTDWSYFWMLYVHNMFGKMHSRNVISEYFRHSLSWVEKKTLFKLHIFLKDNLVSFL